MRTNKNMNIILDGMEAHPKDPYWNHQIISLILLPRQS